MQVTLFSVGEKKIFDPAALGDEHLLSNEATQALGFRKTLITCLHVGKWQVHHLRCLQALGGVGAAGLLQKSRIVGDVASFSGKSHRDFVSPLIGIKRADESADHIADVGVNRRCRKVQVFLSPM